MSEHLFCVPLSWLSWHVAYLFFFSWPIPSCWGRWLLPQSLKTADFESTWKMLGPSIAPFLPYHLPLVFLSPNSLSLPDLASFRGHRLQLGLTWHVHEKTHLRICLYQTWGSCDFILNNKGAIGERESEELNLFLNDFSGSCVELRHGRARGRNGRGYPWDVNSETPDADAVI